MADVKLYKAVFSLYEFVGCYSGQSQVKNVIVLSANEQTAHDKTATVSKAVFRPEAHFLCS